MPYRVNYAFHKMHAEIDHAIECMEGLHPDFLTEEDKDIIVCYALENDDGDNGLDVHEMSDKELLDLYDDWTSYMGSQEDRDRVDRLTAVYNGIILVGVVNET